MAELLALLPIAAVAEHAAVTQTHAVSGIPETACPSKALEVVELIDGLVLVLQPDGGGLVRRVAEDIYRHYGMRR